MTLRDSAYGQETDAVWLVLLTIDHADLATPIRVVNNGTDITSNGEQFVGFPFSVELPTNLEDSPPRARLVVDNVSREIGQVIRQISSPASVMIEIVDGNNADVVEIRWPDFVLTDVKVTALQVSGELSLENFVSEPFPARLFTPASFPGLFK